MEKVFRATALQRGRREGDVCGPSRAGHGGEGPTHQKRVDGEDCDVQRLPPSRKEDFAQLRRLELASESDLVARVSEVVARGRDAASDQFLTFALAVRGLGLFITLFLPMFEGL